MPSDYFDRQLSVFIGGSESALFMVSIAVELHR